jgi:hypothetical protein
MMAQSEEYRKSLQEIENLSRIRDGWNEVEAEETRLLRGMTIKESLDLLFSLQSAFETQLQLTESLFRAERLAYLQDLQKTLCRLAKWDLVREGSTGNAPRSPPIRYRV